MIEVRIPLPGESINEVVLSKWFVEDGGYVEKNQEVGEIESDKATLPLIAPESGVIKYSIVPGTTVKVGTLAFTVDNNEKNKKKEIKEKDRNISKQVNTDEKPGTKNYHDAVKISPVAKKMMEDNNVTADEIIKGLRRIGKDEVNAVLGKRSSEGQKFGRSDGQKFRSLEVQKNTNEGSREVKREQMSQLRKKLSKRLIVARNETAMLTTFNEVDMSAVISLRKKYQQEFSEKYGVKLGFMSFFVRASTIALQDFPKVNSMIEGEEIIIPSFIDIGFAVQTEKGLTVPVLRNTEIIGIPEIEQKISALAEKALKGRLSIDDMTGGTFTITNGGVFGSLLSTPIINPPQAAILGMHNIIERPVAIASKVEIRPMMYLALSYDHRIIDGKDSVTFLLRIKELIVTPVKMLHNNQQDERSLLGL
jgi:2-oxoglutarate dehydrogenase E2 component (dihydrolipoamide succinyltransferase)